MRKLNDKWVHKDSGHEYLLVDVQKAAFGSHEMVTLKSINHDEELVRSTINLHDDFRPVIEEKNE